MYIIFSYDIHLYNEDREETEKKVQYCIKEYIKIKPLDTFYLIKLNHQKDIVKLCDCLKLIWEEYDSSFEYFISRVLSGGIGCQRLNLDSEEEKLFARIVG